MWWIVGFVLVLLHAADRLMVSAGWAHESDTNLRFFLVHILVNMYVIAATAGDLLRTLRAPAAAIFAPFDVCPLLAVAGLHLYHLKDHAELSRVDWVHHLSVLLLAGLTVWCAGDGPGPLCN